MKPVVPIASFPTDAAPGSEAKILIMMARVARGEGCFHPLDAPLGATPRTPTRLIASQRRKAWTGATKVANRFKARLWIPQLKRQVTLGFYATEEESRRVVIRAAALAKVKLRIREYQSGQNKTVKILVHT